MDAARLNLSSLKDKIASKFTSTKNTGKLTKKAGKQKVQKPDNEEENEDDEVLRREAISLGASEADLALLKGIVDGDESEQEFDGENVDKNFSADLSKFMKGIGLEGREVEVIDDEEIPELVEDEEDEEDEEEDENEDDEEAEESEEEENEENESNVFQDASDSNQQSDDEPEVEEMQIKKDKKKSDKITDISAVDSSKLKIPGRLDWYNIPLDPVHHPEKLDKFAIERLYEKAQKIVEDDNQLYLKEFTSNNSQRTFLSQILKDGTLNDKISALTLLMHESPLHNLKAFDTLLYYCEKKSRTAALQAINAFKDLLINGLLPDRRLMAFNKRPLTKDLSDTHLAVYFFEDHLKKSYFKIIQILEHLCHDPIVHVKMNVVGHIFDLLKAKPEQEANLLRLGVNKLGDIERKVAGKASYQILQLEQAHPAMKKIILEAVIDTVFKPNSEHNAQYYAVLTLNQTILTRKESELANELVNTYFSLFQKVLIESDDKTKEKKGDKALGKSEKGRNNKRKNFKKGKKGGKSVKQQEKTESELIEERNSKLFSGLLTGLNRAFPFANLPNETYQSHLDTLFKITHSSNFNTSVQALVLVNHILSRQNLDSDRYYRTLYESLLDPRLLASSKQGIYLNLLFKSLKNDKEHPERVMAFVKRILQICSHWLNTGTVAGMLYLLTELAKDYPQILHLTIDANSRPDEEDDEKPVTKKENEIDADKEYDSRKRDPKFANADKSSLWELSQFLNHYHPTIAIYAQSFLDGTPQTKPDLGLYTLSHFLDRFVYRNAKQKPVTKGSSIMQPLGGAHTGSMLVRSTNVTNNEMPANTENWLAKKSQDVRPDEEFFHQYFTTKESKLKSKRGKKDEPEELEDDEVWNALVKSKPDIENDSDEDSIGFDEEDFSDFDEDDEEDNEEDDGEGEQVDGYEEEEDDEEGEEQVEATGDFDDADFDGQLQVIDDQSDGEAVDFIDKEDELTSDEEQAEATKKRTRDDDKKKSKKSKKQKIKDLPVFASADDYSKYLDSDDEDYS